MSAERSSSRRSSPIEYCPFAWRTGKCTAPLAARTDSTKSGPCAWVGCTRKLPSLPCEHKDVEFNVGLSRRTGVDSIVQVVHTRWQANLLYLCSGKFRKLIENCGIVIFFTIHASFPPPPPSFSLSLPLPLFFLSTLSLLFFVCVCVCCVWYICVSLCVYICLCVSCFFQHPHTHSFPSFRCYLLQPVSRYDRMIANTEIARSSIDWI